MKRAWIVVLLLAGTVGAQSDKAPVEYPTIEEAIKHGNPNQCIAFRGPSRYISVECNAGGAYQVAQSDKNIGKSNPVKPGDVLVVSPTNTLTQTDIYLRRNSDGHLIYSKNGGQELDIDAAYDKFVLDQHAGVHTAPLNMLPTTNDTISASETGWFIGTVGVHGGGAPKRTGEFHPQCRYKLDNGDSEVGDCPEGSYFTGGEIHLKNGEHHEIDCTKDPCVRY